MRRRVRPPIEAPHSAAPNRSGDGAPASPHHRLGSRSYGAISRPERPVRKARVSVEQRFAPSPAAAL